MGIFFERALTALERIADALTSLAETAKQPLPGMTPVVESGPEGVQGQAGTEGVQGQAGTEAPAAGRTRVSKARREEVRDAVLAAGLDLDSIEKDFNAVWGSWSGAQCDKAEALAAGAKPAAPVEPQPAAPDDVKPASYYDKDREDLTAAIVRIKGVMTAERAEPIITGIMCAVGGTNTLITMNPAKYAAVAAAITAAIPEPVAHFGDEKPAPSPAAEAKPITLEAVRALAQQLTAKLGDKQPVRDIIQRVAGTPKLTDVPKEKFAELFQALEEAA